MAEQQFPIPSNFFFLFLFQIFTRFGKVLKIVTFTKNSKYLFLFWNNELFYLKKKRIWNYFFYINYGNEASSLVIFFN